MQMACSAILQEFEESVYVGVPGAGGDDAIFVIAQEEDQVEAKLQSFLAGSEIFNESERCGAVLAVSQTN